MPTIIETKAFTLDELDETAKERAREWYRAGDTDHDHEFMYDDFVRVGNLLGIEFDTNPVMSSAGTIIRRDPRIYWSGFCSQGDGACFEGTWKFRRGALDEIKEHAPQDSTLHDIAEQLWPMRFGAEDNLWASVKHSGNYYHENSITIDVGDGDDDYSEIDEVAVTQIEEGIRAFCRWMYRQLEIENDWRYSAECVDENINANEYLFEENGEFIQ